MKATHCGLILLAALIPGAFAGDLNGTWYATFADTVPEALRPADKIGFDLDAKGGTLTGLAFLGSLGVAELSEGKIEGDRFSFKVRTVAFEGTVEGKQLKLVMMIGDAKPMTGEKVESKVTAPVSVNASAEDVSGTWKTWFVGRIGDRPKMFDGFTLNLKVEGGRVTGSADAGNWPGDCPISAGRYEGGHFWFTATGQKPSSSGLPKFEFEGTIHGKELKLTMMGGRGSQLPMDGKKMP